MRDTYEDRAPVGEQIIDPIRDREADGIGAEIVIIDAHRRAIPLDAMVLEVANQFSFLGIDTDNRKPLTLKAGAQREIYRNCWSRSGLESVAMALRFTRREKSIS